MPAVQLAAWPTAAQSAATYGDIVYWASYTAVTITGYSCESRGGDAIIPETIDWLPFSGLLTQYPDAIGEEDDPDQDGLSNYAEMLAGTDHTDPASVPILELVPRPNELSEADRAPIGPSQHAVHLRSVPGKSYGAQWAQSLDGTWTTTGVVTATTTQKRLVFNKPATQAFYRGDTRAIRVGRSASPTRGPLEA